MWKAIWQELPCLLRLKSKKYTGKRFAEFAIIDKQSSKNGIPNGLFTHRHGEILDGRCWGYGSTEHRWGFAQCSKGSGSFTSNFVLLKCKPGTRNKGVRREATEWALFLQRPKSDCFHVSTAFQTHKAKFYCQAVKELAGEFPKEWINCYLWPDG